MTEAVSKRGGKRVGAGRPKTGQPPRTMRSFRLSEEEHKIVKEFVHKLKAENKKY